MYHPKESHAAVHESLQPFLFRLAKELDILPTIGSAYGGTDGSHHVHPDGTRHPRLDRLYPYGSSLWKEHYDARKNAVEGRNSQITRLGLKHIWSYGLAGATADISFADLLINLRTLGRLAQEATLLSG